MHIVLEGPDNSGKSTLARFLSDTLNLPVQASEGPEKFPGEINQRVSGYLQLPRTIFDRHPCVSQEIYRHYNGTTSINQANLNYFYNSCPIFIYCDTSRDLKTHVVKDHDSKEHLELLRLNHTEIVLQYRVWAMKHANILYRINDSMARISAMIRGVYHV